MFAAHKFTLDSGQRTLTYDQWSEYKGQTYYFCSLGCKKAFDKEPEKYVEKTQE
ncbi:MAG: YHS domain-containing protein [Chloroflexi bacterium]|nr:YHS domain-containing protein [Chloroflexota bacterium]